MRHGRRVIGDDEVLAFADAAEFDRPLAVLRRLDRVGLVQLSASGVESRRACVATIASVFDGSICPAIVTTALSGW